ncbi:hypothetical protein F7D01_04025 [Erythrobacter sp. 3-20A1M]|uniref:hypothetical protein n=1 Tax=Erythrobacter sp. 3-20A1M TaxID=2653850 RepID=UPI001BFC81A5|nr:hypothetical protein [Erythrobacter sp. 3-20A1M]QWC56365.1 hypothetical protein F7D01_04025 [Erythrobacter sp. 3-20A1M]
MRRVAPALCAIALLTGGCAQRIAESRVRSALLDAGLSRNNADCMAERMVDRLTIDQLKKLEGMKARRGESDKPTSLRDFVNRVRRVGDGEVVTVTASSAALCYTGLANERR